MASVATCEDLEKGLRISPDPQFKGIKFWEKPLANLYRLKYWHHGGPTTISDWVSGDATVFTAFLAASENTGGLCDPEILRLMQRYIDGSRSLDDYDATGLPALHQAIIFKKKEFVRMLLDGGADRSLVARTDNPRIQNMDAVALAIWFSEQENSTPASAEIATMLVNPD